MIVVAWVCAALLAAAAAMALVRVERGPSMLDRTIALDTLTAVLVAGIGVHAAWTRRTDTVPIIVAMSLIGFVGSAAIARFAAVEPEGEGRVLTREEADALESTRREGLDPDADRVAEADRAADDDREAGR